VNAVATDGQAVPAPIVTLSLLEKKYIDTYIQASMDGVRAFMTKLLHKLVFPFDFVLFMSVLSALLRITASSNIFPIISYNNHLL
jgi:hypothetical protein